MTPDFAILIVSADLEARRDLFRILTLQGCDPLYAPTIGEAMKVLERQSIGLVFCERELPDGGYRNFLTAARGLKTKSRIVVTSRLADWDEYLECMRLGAFDVIASPCRPTDV